MSPAFVGVSIFRRHRRREPARGNREVVTAVAIVHARKVRRGATGIG
jgi:hypothetical protein